MDSNTLNILISFAGIIIGGLITGFFLKGKDLINLEKKQLQAKELLDTSESESKEILEKAKIQLKEREENLNQLISDKKERFKKTEASLQQRESNIEKRIERINELKFKIASLEEEVQGVRQSIKNIDKQIFEKLTSKTLLSVEKVKEDLLRKNESDLKHENAEKIAKIEEEVKESSEKASKKILINIMQRLCSPTSVESRAVHVNVPKDHIKGKIIGKDGCNIVEIERALDVDIIFNDLPNTISISAFNLVNRRIAQKTIEKLVRFKGVISKEIIERAIKKATEETDEELYNIGQKALKNMRMEEKDEEFTRIVGRLQYRTSYGQNIMRHSMEVGWVAGMIASEIGLNAETAKVAGFLHDVGKAIDQDPNVQDTHDHLTKVLMEKYGYNWEETHAAWTHHDAIPQETAEALLIKAADAVSAGRPGARQESIDRYLERIKALEETANKFKGVKKSFAISAGRELRILVEPEELKDQALGELAKKVVEDIEDNLVYPGKIKVNVIRKTEYMENAKVK